MIDVQRVCFIDQILSSARISIILKSNGLEKTSSLFLVERTPDYRMAKWAALNEESSFDELGIRFREKINRTLYRYSEFGFRMIIQDFTKGGRPTLDFTPHSASASMGNSKSSHMQRIHPGIRAWLPLSLTLASTPPTSTLFLLGEKRLPDTRFRVRHSIIWTFIEHLVAALGVVLDGSPKNRNNRRSSSKDWPNSRAPSNLIEILTLFPAGLMS